MSKCNCCVLLYESIHEFMHLLCWIYSHPLVADWAPTPLWCRFARRRSLVAVSLWGWFWSLLVYLSFLGVFFETMLWSVTLGVGDLFYYRVDFRIFWIQFWCRYKRCESYFGVLKNLFCYYIFYLNQIFLNWRRCATPYHV